jgi:CTP synthase (UTP-ammonia lyase)
MTSTPQTPVPSRPARIALVGDRSPHVTAHDRIPAALAQAARAEGLAPDAIDPYWIGSEQVAALPDLAGFDGIWVVPGSPYADRDGALAAIRTARTGQVPFLGTCGGFQHAVLEYARSVLGLDVDHAEDPFGAAAGPIIVPLECSLRGEEAEVDVLPDTRAAGILGAGPRIERFFCAYGLDERFRASLADAGLVFSAADGTGAVRMLELPGHPFYLASLFQPELSSDASWVHPLIRAFAAAALSHASAGSAAAMSTRS